MKTPIVCSALGAAVVLAALVACGGGGGGASPVPGSGTTPLPPSSQPTAASATPTPPVASGQTTQTSQGSVSGEPNMFTPNEGDTASGGQGSPVDGITCDPTMSNNYHIHVFLGVYVNGTQMALPIAIGMQNPGAASDGFIDTASCFYHIHTHDSSGLVHVEDPNPNNIPITGTMYTLQNVLDVWGITASANNFGQFSGPVEVFTSGQVFRGDDANSGVVPATDLTYWGSNPNTVPLYSHEYIVVEVGPTYPTSLPGVFFYIEN
ncbi:MAG TPA: hypothetical protein VMG98_14290 [Verrucomicrobiae bacterium]|nr:hypothetical protein [Verrucomicrobiae bacterium]